MQGEGAGESIKNKNKGAKGHRPCEPLDQTIPDNYLTLDFWLFPPEPPTPPS